MTITVNNILTLMEYKAENDRIEYAEQKKQIDYVEVEMKAKKAYLERLLFHMDKQHKLYEIIKHDHKHTTGFYSIHDNIAIWEDKNV